MHAIQRSALALVLIGLAAAAQAQKLAPGLWEMTMDMKAQGGEMEAGMARMQAELAKMPPEQRKQMEAMMAQRGVGMPGAGAKGVSVKTCISKETAERGEPPAQDREGQRCKRENVSRSGATMKFRISCTNPTTTGEGEYTFISDKAYSGKMVMDTGVKGKPEHVEMQQQGKWLSSDCGTLKPH